MKQILLVIGTRPEAIKMAPLINKLKKSSHLFNVKVLSTGQHREMLKPILSFFNIVPDFDLNLMKPGQNLVDITSQVLFGMNSILSESKFDLVMAQGDTTTAMAAALSAFYHKVPVAHVEAGLRTGDIFSPWPEEANRKIITQLAQLHFVPTENTKNALLKENVDPKSVYITGNTVIDALLIASKKVDENLTISHRFSSIDFSKKTILATVHRRESFGQPIRNILNALKKLAKLKNCQIIFPVHLNPQVRNEVNTILNQDCVWLNDSISPSNDHLKNNSIYLCDPLDYLSFIYIMKKSYLIISDSGGVQEEAPSLGKPVLIARDNTERPEAIQAGSSILVGTDEEKILETASLLLSDYKSYEAMANVKNPYGDGTASDQIEDHLVNYLFKN